jgi:hypothetical protein
MLPTNPLLNATAPAGPHLPVALLRQYAAGTLAPAAQHRVEAHTLACPRCADILAGLLQTPAATTDQALAQLQQRLRQRVQQAAAPARQVAAPRRHRWLAPQLAAAAALLLGLVAGGWWTWQQRQHAPAAATVASSLPRPRAAQPATPPALAETSVISADTLKGLAGGATSSPARSKAVAQEQTIAATTASAARRRVAALRRPGSQAPVAPTSSQAPVVASQAAPVSGTAPDTAAPVATRPASAAPALASAASPVAAPAPTARTRALMPPPPALPATPAGGYRALREYLKKETAEFDPEAKDGPRRSGRVLVRLHIGADGKIEQAEAVRKLRPDYDAEAIRLLQEGPAWVPGITAGRRAAQVVDVPVVFEEPGL